MPPKSTGDYAFITHMIEIANKANGRVGVVIPNGVLFRGGSEGKIRQKLIEENLLDAVIGLPVNLFFGTGIPAALLIFKRNRSDQSIVFIDGSREFEQGTNQNRLRRKDIEKITSAYRTRQSIGQYAYLANFDEIKENDFNLNIPRYVDTFEEEELVNMRAVNAHIDSIREDLLRIESLMRSYLRELGLDE